MSVVAPILSPDPSLMRQHLDHLFAGHSEGQIELAWTADAADASGKFQLRYAEWFHVTDRSAIIARACELNSRPMVNVYIGAAIRKPETAPFGRSHDSDAWLLTCAYVDLDEPDSVPFAKDAWSYMKPTWIVGTGRDPHLRAQAYWKLEEPMTDHHAWSALLKALARALKGDNTVTNPGRVLRLAGTVAWPQKPGRKTEPTYIGETVGDPRPRAAYNVKALAGHYRYDPAIDLAPAPGVTETVTRSTNSLGLADKIEDGREKYMTATLFAVFIEYVGENGCAPTVEDLVEVAWPQYEAKVDLTRPGRGIDEMRRKAAYLLRRFADGELRGLPDEEAVIEAYRGRRQQQAVDYAAADFADGQAPDQSDGPFPAADFSGEPPELKWLVEEWIPCGVICALYGDGGVGKTLLAQQLLYAAGVGGEWLGMAVPKMSALGVFCEDDRDELHRRHNAIKAALGYTLGNPFDQTWIWPRVGFDNLLVTFDKDNRPTMSAFFEAVMRHVLEKRVGLLALDTVADLYGGNEIIRAQVNFFIKSTCGAFIRRAKEAGFELTVILLAHPSQSGKESGRGDGGSTAWSNAVRSRLYLIRPEDGGADDRSLSRKKSNYSSSGDDTAIDLVWRDGVIVRRVQGSNMPDRNICERMLADITEAWNAGVPLSTASQTKKDGRYAARVLARRYQGNEKAFEGLIERWLEERIVVNAERNSDTKMKGLKVIGSITEVTEVGL